MDFIQKIHENLDAVLHWNMSLIGGFLGTYALLRTENFGSAQTGNILEMARDLTTGNYPDLACRAGAWAIFMASIILAFLLTEFSQLHMRRLVILVDAVCIAMSALIPDSVHPIVLLYPIFFCSAFQWGTFSSAQGYNSASIFTTNNFKQCALAWTQFIINRDRETRKKAIMYSWTVICFALGAFLGALSVTVFGRPGALVCWIPLLCARLFVITEKLPDAKVVEVEEEPETVTGPETMTEAAEEAKTEKL